MVSILVSNGADVSIMLLVVGGMEIHCCSAFFILEPLVYSWFIADLPLCGRLHVVLRISFLRKEAIFSSPLLSVGGRLY